MFLLTPEFQSMNLLQQVLYMFIATNSVFWFHFSRFSWQESALVASGISYVANFNDKGENFNTMPCIEIEKWHWSPNLKIAIPTWNMRVQDWLKYHMNLRLVDRTLPRGQRQLLPFFLTTVSSLFFHGFYHGFAGFFVCMAVNEIAQNAFASTRLSEQIAKPFPPFLVTMFCRA